MDDATEAEVSSKTHTHDRWPQAQLIPKDLPHSDRCGSATELQARKSTSGATTMLPWLQQAQHVQRKAPENPSPPSPSLEEPLELTKLQD